MKKEQSKDKKDSKGIFLLILAMLLLIFFKDFIGFFIFIYAFIMLWIVLPKLRNNSIEIQHKLLNFKKYSGWFLFSTIISFLLVYSGFAISYEKGITQLQYIFGILAFLFLLGVIFAKGIYDTPIKELNHFVEYMNHKRGAI